MTQVNKVTLGAFLHSHNETGGFLSADFEHEGFYLDVRTTIQEIDILIDEYIENKYPEIELDKFYQITLQCNHLGDGYYAWEILEIKPGERHDK